MHRYKSPRLYGNGDYLPDDATQGKYADDLFAGYISNFIDSNVANPFFIYFPLSLCHSPFSPTPDNPEYGAWDPLVDKSDPKFYPSMVKYMDKKVQQVKNKIETAGLTRNTIIIYMGDNGTPGKITSKYKGEMLKGGKATSTIHGTHVPLIITWPGTISAQQTSDALIDPSDFLPSLAAMANVAKPGNYGTLDGISFYPLLFGSKERLRDWIYFYWNPQYENPISRVWVQDEEYKLYDSTNNHFFFSIANDPLEQRPLRNDKLSTDEARRKNTFDSILSVMHN
jgi:arylsulfatase A